MQESLLNGLAFAAFGRTNAGEWIVSDLLGGSRVVGSEAQAIALRRRSLRQWFPALLLGIVVYGVSRDLNGILLALGLSIPFACALANGPVLRLERSEIELGKREIAYQHRIWVFIFAPVVFLAAVAAMTFSVRLSESSLAWSSAALFMTAAAMTVAFRRYVKGRVRV